MHMPEEIIRIEHPASGLQAFIVLDEVRAGRTFGGIRVARYPDAAAALRDAQALARAMTLKAAFAGLPGGGAKTVVFDWRDRPAAMRALGRHIRKMKGRYLCGGDLGFTAADLAAVRSETHYIASRDVADATGRTIVASLDAAQATGCVAVQGLGAIGLSVARRLRERGARVIAWDPDKAARARAAGCEFDETILEAPCDAFSPCAVGGVLDERTIPRLRCRVVAGGANNPLAGPDDARRLAERGILYVPDFVANAGALIQGAGSMLGRDPESILLAWAARVRALLDRARAEGRTPLEVAVDIAMAAAS